MKKIILAVLVAAFGYTCAMAQAPATRANNAPIDKPVKSKNRPTINGAVKQKKVAKKADYTKNKIAKPSPKVQPKKEIGKSQKGRYVVSVHKRAASITKSRNNGIKQ